MSPVSLDLLVGRRRTGISVKPDPVHPSMWRIHQGDHVSDMVNLARARDAAISWATRSEGFGVDSCIVLWEVRRSSAEAPYSALNQAAA
jgi:hypothetical protein